MPYRSFQIIIFIAFFLANSCGAQSTNPDKATTIPPGSILSNQDSDKELREAINESYRVDQSDPKHTKAAECYTKLLSLEPRFANSDLKASFLQALSLESFHLGQTEALEKGNSTIALLYFQRSMEYALASEAAWKLIGIRQAAASSTEWANYVKATVAYFKNDAETLELLHNKCSPVNEKVVMRLYKGLRQNHTVDYQRDY